MHKIFKLGINGTWSEMDLEKAEETEIKMPTPTGS